MAKAADHGEYSSALRVIELANDSLSASFAGTILAGLGMEVIKVEVGDRGDALRSRPPTLGETEVSGPFLYTAPGKRWLNVADDEAGQEVARTVAERADILLGDGDLTPGLRASGATVIVTPFGLSGPSAAWRTDAIGAFHAGGVGFVTPRCPQEGTDALVVPQAPFGYLAEYFCGLYVAMVALAYGIGGGGHVVDLSMQDCFLPLTRREIGAWLSEQRLASRRDRLWHVGPSDFFPVADGQVYVSVIEDAQWERLVALSGWKGPLPDGLASARGRAERTDEVRRVIGPWLRSQTREQVLHRTGRAGVPVGPVLSGADLAGEPYLWEQGMLSQLSGTGDDSVTVPAPVLTGEPHYTSGCALSAPPAIGRDSGSVLRDLGYSDAELEALIELGVVLVGEGGR
jgi:crotonobetainyl-CoA:carnitine CoA-transferase CaiB-like acyl-CoA transferase